MCAIGYLPNLLGNKCISECDPISTYTFQDPHYCFCHIGKVINLLGTRCIRTCGKGSIKDVDTN